jgi:primosomal protein N' (replication factor Y)
MKGLGTEKVERELSKSYPGVRILRMDSDTTRRRHAHRDMFQAFRRHDADILLGTQMIAKGFDFPSVTLVGVISADTSLNLPDLRSAERTFQLITQVAGRAGRSDLGGEVVVQTFSPELDVIRTAASQKYREFFDVEAVQRSELDYPPFSRMAKITIRSSDSTLAQTTAQKLKRAVETKVRKNGRKMLVLGPAPAPIFRLKGNYRYRILLKSREPMVAQRILDPVLASWPIPRKVRLVVDIDPVGTF